DVHEEIQNTINLWYPYISNHGAKVDPQLEAKNTVVDLAPHAFRELLSVLLVNSVEAHADEITIVTEDIQDVEAPENNFIKLAIQIDVVDNGNGLIVRDTEI